MKKEQMKVEWDEKSLQISDHTAIKVEIRTDKGKIEKTRERRMIPNRKKATEDTIEMI